jgi:DNA-binding CsgD family transcriptional regulator
MRAIEDVAGIGMARHRDRRRHYDGEHSCLGSFQSQRAALRNHAPLRAIPDRRIADRRARASDKKGLTNIYKHADARRAAIALERIKSGPENAGQLHLTVADNEGLSTRELEVLRWLAQGLTVKEIAESMGLSPKTVANHQSAIKQKLEADTAIELVRRVNELGLET